MNKGFISLIKIQFRALSNSLFQGSKKKNTKQYLAIILPVALSLYLSCTMSFSFASIYFKEDYYILYAITLIMILFLVLMFSIYQIGGHLFNSKDYQLLSSLPFSQKQILFAKLISFYAYQYIYIIVGLIAPSYLYLTNGGNILSVIIIVLLSILLPIIPITIASIISIVIMKITSLFKNKSLITILFYLIFIMAVVSLETFIMPTDNETMLNATNTLLFYKKVYYPLYAISNIARSINIIDIGLFILLHLAVMALFLSIFAKSYDRINKDLSKNKKHITKKVEDNEYIKNSIQKALVKKEIKRYFQMPMYVLNTLIGPIMLAGAGIFACFAGLGDIEMIKVMLGKDFIITIIIAITFMCIVSLPSTSSISLEGQHIYILKTLPIKANDIFMSKIKASIIIYLPLSVIGIILICWSLGIEPLLIVLITIYAIMAIALASILGLFINTKWPNFEWTNEALVVKQSAAVLIGMLTDFVLFGLFIALLYFINNAINIAVALLVTICILISLSLIIIKYLNKNALKIMNSF